MNTNREIRRHHHITLNVGGAQEDYDFHTKVLGLKSVKKTALYDGDEPIHHLYYGNDLGDASTLITTFPMRQSGRKARKGSGQISTLMLSCRNGFYWTLSTGTQETRQPFVLRYSPVFACAVGLRCRMPNPQALALSDRALLEFEHTAG